jgi:hypothetical protein
LRVPFDCVFEYFWELGLSFYCLSDDEGAPTKEGQGQMQGQRQAADGARKNSDSEIVTEDHQVVKAS